LKLVCSWSLLLDLMRGITAEQLNSLVLFYY
jgi:hypothetical protein